jgi:acetolactate synthase I/II/III large subunit
MLTGAAHLLATLADLGVDTIFGYPGGAVLPLYDALVCQDRIQHILVRHEQAAVHAAEGYARSSGRLGVVLVTSGPGATNALTGLADAMMDSVPLLCIAGQVNSALIGTDGFQEANIVSMSRSATKYNISVRHPGWLEALVRRAVGIALGGRPGPVLINLPKDVQSCVAPINLFQLMPPPISLPTYAKPNATDVTAAAAMIRSARKPILYTGGGVINSGSRARACRHLSQTRAHARCSPARKFRAVFS